jgi:hypothetical protein
MIKKRALLEKELQIEIQVRTIIICDSNLLIIGQTRMYIYLVLMKQKGYCYRKGHGVDVLRLS